MRSAFARDDSLSQDRDQSPRWPARRRHGLRAEAPHSELMPQARLGAGSSFEAAMARAIQAQRACVVGQPKDTCGIPDSRATPRVPADCSDEMSLCERGRRFIRWK